MKSLFTFILVVLVSCAATAQKDNSKTTDSTNTSSDTLAPYQKSQALPTFSIQLPDSSWFHRSTLKPNLPVLIIYFSPDCGHCQMETEDIIAKINALKKLQIVMVTSRPFEDMVNYASHYKLRRFPSIKIGKDHGWYISKFFDVKFTPFSALYDKDGKLLKVYKKGIDYTELINLVN